MKFLKLERAKKVSLNFCVYEEKYFFIKIAIWPVINSESESLLSHYLGR